MLIKMSVHRCLANMICNAANYGLEIQYLHTAHEFLAFVKIFKNNLWHTSISRTTVFKPRCWQVLFFQDAVEDNDPANVLFAALNGYPLSRQTA